MLTFEEMLAQHIQGMNSRFQQADQDLHQVVAEAAKSISRISNGNTSIQLATLNESTDGIMYNLQFVGKGSTINLCSFQVKATGYPIAVPGAGVGSAKTMTNRGEIESFLNELASNPDSPLVRQLAFTVRKK